MDVAADIQSQTHWNMISALNSKKYQSNLPHVQTQQAISVISPSMLTIDPI